jgi:hypothetical protein
MKRSLFLSVILFPLLSYAQSVDSSARPRLVTTAPRLGGVTVTDQVVPIKAGGNTFIVQRPIVDIGVPIYKDFTTAHPLIIKTGFRYEGLFLSGEKNIGSSAFHSLTVPLLVTYSLSRTTNLSLIGLASVNSDFKRSIEAEDILYTAGIRIGFRPNSSLRYGVTLTYVSNFSGKFLLPLPDVDWTISKRWSLSAIVPARVSLNYKLSEAQSLGVTGSYTSSTFLLNESATAQKQYLNLQQFSGGLLYDVSLTRRWKLNLIAGHTFSQRLETFNMDQKVSFNNFAKLRDRTPNVSYRQNSFIFQGGLSFQF